MRHRQNRDLPLKIQSGLLQRLVDETVIDLLTYFQPLKSLNFADPKFLSQNLRLSDLAQIYIDRNLPLTTTVLTKSSTSYENVVSLE